MREARENRSVALKAVNFLSIPGLLLWLCLGNIKMFATFSFPLYVFAIIN